MQRRGVALCVAWRRCGGRALHTRGAGGWSASAAPTTPMWRRARDRDRDDDDDGDGAAVDAAAATWSCATWSSWERDFWPTPPQQADGSDAAGARNATAAAVAAAAVRDAAMREARSNAELFPHWPMYEAAPRAQFAQLAPALQARYVLNRLAMAERRVRYAAEYSMYDAPQQLAFAERMLLECEALLREELHYMPASLQARLRRVKADVARIRGEHAY